MTERRLPSISRAGAPRALVVVVSRGEPAALEATLASVAAQRGVDVRAAIVTHGAARARDAARASSLVARVEGPDDASVLGGADLLIEHAQRELIAIVEAGDLLLPDAIALAAAALAESGAALAVGAVELVDPEGHHVGLVEAGDPGVIEPPDMFRRLVPANIVPRSAAIVRRDALAAVGGLDPALAAAAPRAAWLALSLRFRVVVLPHPVVQQLPPRELDATTVRSAAASQLAALLAACADPLVPDAWRPDLPRLVAAQLLHEAVMLDAAGAIRRDAGMAAYALAGEALLACPEEPSVLNAFRGLARRAELDVPAPPFDIVAPLRGAPGEAESLVVALTRLGQAGLVRRARIGIADADAAVAFPALHRCLAVAGTTPPPDTVLVDAVDLVRPGVLVLADEGDPAIPSAEALGVPAIGHRGVGGAGVMARGRAA